MFRSGRDPLFEVFFCLGLLVIVSIIAVFFQ